MEKETLVNIINGAGKYHLFKILEYYLRPFQQELYDLCRAKFGDFVPIIHIGWIQQNKFICEALNAEDDDVFCLWIGTHGQFKLEFEKVDIEYIIDLIEENKDIIKEKYFEIAPKVIANLKYAKDLINKMKERINSTDAGKLGEIDIISKNHFIDLTCDYNLKYISSYSTVRDKISFDLSLDPIEFEQKYIFEKKIISLEQKIYTVSIDDLIQRCARELKNYGDKNKKNIKLSVNEKYALINWLYETENKPMDVINNLIHFKKKVPCGLKDKFNSLIVLAKLSNV